MGWNAVDRADRNYTGAFREKRAIFKQELTIEKHRT